MSISRVLENGKKTKTKTKPKWFNFFSNQIFQRSEWNCDKKEPYENVLYMYVFNAPYTCIHQEIDIYISQ